MKLNDKSYQPNGRYLYIIACFVIIITGLKAAQSVLVPIMLAFFIATVSYPMTSWMIGHKVPKSLAVALTVFVDAAFVIGMTLISITLLGDLQEKWSTTYYELISSQIVAATENLKSLMTTFGNEEISDSIQQYQDGTTSLMTMLVQQIDQVLNFVDMKQVWSVSTDVLGSVMGFLGTGFVVLVLTVFMIAEADEYGSRINLITRNHGPNIKRILSASKDIQRFMGIKTLASLLTGILGGILCYFLGLDFFVLFGVITFLLNYIPVVGSVIAAIPPIALGLLVGGLPLGIWVTVGYTAINLFIGNFLEPMMTGSRLGISTLVVILSVMFWGWMWGPVGMLLAVPVTMLIKAMLNNSEELRWLAIAITKTNPKKLAAVKEDDCIEEAIQPEKVIH